MLITLLFIAGAYCIGSVSSAILVCRVLGLPDPRTEHSKNPGTTNVLRIGGKIPALITLLGDASKGLIPVALAKLFGIHDFFIGCVALAAFLGHIYPVFFAFQGGKGVATTLGTFLGISLLIGGMSLIVWLIVAAISRYSSLAALTTAIFACLAISLFINGAYFLPLFTLTVLLFWRHKGNISRLIAGNERKINLH